MASLIGNKPNQVSTNGDLGTLAFQDSNAVNISGGTVDVSAGTAALPTLGTTGDPNTGVFFPAADTVAVATNGVERVRVDASGNLGIGTTSPYTKLDVNGSTGLKVYATTGTDLNSVGSIALGDGNRSANYTGLYRGTSISGGAASNALTLGAYDYIGFNVSATTLGSQTERMRIHASGGLSLGNTTDAGAGNLNVTGSGKFGSGVTGLIVQTLVGGGFGAIYNANLTPSATNYGFITNTNSTYINNSAQSGLLINANPIAIATSTGLAVTGVLSSSGLFSPQQAATAPTYVKGAIYFDTTLNKLRVGGATGWETITSV